MSTLPETNEIRKNYPMYLEGNYRWLWHSDYYDGPMTGMVEVNGKMLWAVWIDEEDWVEWESGEDDEPGEYERRSTRYYALLDLGKERTDYEEYWHELFRLCVGTHCDWEYDGVRRGEVIHNEATQKFYYGRRKADYKELDASKYPIVGWFAW